MKWEQRVAEKIRSRQDQFGSFVRRIVEAIGGAIENNRWLAVSLLVAVYVFLALLEGHAMPFTNDEVYTIHIAQAPTYKRMLWMSREIDLHPPFHYLAQRLFLHIPGPLWLISRLPSMISGLVVTLVLFWMIAPRLGNLLGMLSAALPWTGPLAMFAWQNRPYMIWMLFLVLLIATWKKAISEDRKGWHVGAVFLLAALMVSNLLISILCLGAFMVAELVRWRARGRTDILLWLALTAPMLIGLGYFYQMRHLGSNSFPFWQIPSLGWGERMYIAMITQMFFLLSVSLAVTGFLGKRRRNVAMMEPEERPLQLPLVEGVLYWSLILVPVLLMFVAVFAHIQFWERYGSSAIIGFACVIPWMLYRRVRDLRLITTLMVIWFLGTTVQLAIEDGTIKDNDRPAFFQIGRKPIWLGQLDPKLPIVDASPMTFTEMSFREPLAISSRVYYLTDRNLADKYSGYTLFENEDKIREILDLPSHAEDMTKFLSEHDRFYMVATYQRGTDWLPRAFADMGIKMDYLGKFVSHYGDEDLFMVTTGTRDHPANANSNSHVVNPKTGLVE